MENILSMMQKRLLKLTALPLVYLLCKVLSPPSKGSCGRGLTRGPQQPVEVILGVDGHNRFSVASNDPIKIRNDFALPANSVI